MNLHKFKQILHRAKEGDIAIQYELATRYLDGVGRRKNVKKGMYWLKEAATGKSIEALFRLGELYWCGSGKVKENQKVALYYFKEAATLGLAKAQYLLGAIYATDSKRIDLSQAVKWYEKASKNGDNEATYNLGIMYLNGEGIAKDIEKGLTLIEKSALAGFELAIDFLIQHKAK